MATKKTFVVFGLGFGDEGKGTIVDYLAQKYYIRNIVKISGGAQAAHHVHYKDKKHCFSQFGSSALPVRTHLLEDFIIEPFAMDKEATQLKEFWDIDKPERLMNISPMCLITTPIHMFINRAKEELRGSCNHGTCGFGIGETRRIFRENGLSYAIFVRDIESKTLKAKLQSLLNTALNMFRPEHLSEKLNQHRDLLKNIIPELVAYYEDWASRYVIMEPNLQEESMVIEMTQGTLLDENFGFHPHTTWSSVTAKAARRYLLKQHRNADIVGVTRTYLSRHGTGPIYSSFADGEIDKKLRENDDNAVNDFQGSMRYGPIDMGLLTHIIRSMHFDIVAITHCDLSFKPLGLYQAKYNFTYPHNVEDSMYNSTQYLLGKRDYIDANTSQIINEIRNNIKYPAILSYGKTWEQKEEKGM